MLFFTWSQVSSKLFKPRVSGICRLFDKKRFKNPSTFLARNSFCCTPVQREELKFPPCFPQNWSKTFNPRWKVHGPSTWWRRRRAREFERIMAREPSFPRMDTWVTNFKEQSFAGDSKWTFSNFGVRRGLENWLLLFTHFFVRETEVLFSQWRKTRFAGANFFLLFTVYSNSHIMFSLS